MPVTTNIYVDEIEQTAVDKIDLLFMIDNSASMTDKQAILRLAVPDLVERLVNPVCIDAAGNQRDPAPPGAPCPPGQSREFNPIEDIHVGVISSSLGDVGANQACPSPGMLGYDPESADMAHLVGSLARGAGSGANRAGFLEWRAGTTDPAQFSEDFARMVESVGEGGCGFEASLESWYRFLVDPFPYRELERVDCSGGRPGNRDCVTAARDGAGNALLDDTLLAQRAAFLRPDSLVAVIMLSDENDCSVQMGGQSWKVLETDRRMFRASSACAQDPNAKCCYSCGAAQRPEGCEPDPVCEIEDREAGIFPQRTAPELDHPNLRCFDQKRRFGIDLLYPTQRYVNALTEYELCVSAADLGLEGCPAQNRAPNPLFAGGRSRSLVFLGGIVGVPWQLISSDVDQNGRKLEDPARQLRFKSFEQLSADRTWDQVVGSRGTPWRPAGGGQPEVASVPPTPPASPYMVESERPRPLVMDSNEINGRDYDTTQGSEDTPSDLQYACIFPLPESRMCTDEVKERDESCDCFDGELDKPLCQAPGSQTPTITQHWAKAYPGTRQLEVLRDFGENSIVASICARNVDISTRTTRPDFGYRPAIAAIVDRLKLQLVNRCLPRAVEVDDDGTVPCTMVETRRNPSGACECDARTARKRPSARVDALVRAQLASDGPGCGPEDPQCQRACLCEVLQVQLAENPDPEEALRVCREEIEPAGGVEGWCYVANTPDQQIGNPDLVAECRPTERQQLRFVGTGLEPNTTTFLACVGSSLSAREVSE